MEHFNTSDGWPQTRDEVREMSLAGLHEFMGLCDVEPADFDACLACYAYQVAQEREVGSPTTVTSLPLVHVPLAPLDSPTPTCRHEVYRHEVYDEDEDDVVRCGAAEDDPIHDQTWTTSDSELARKARAAGCHPFDPTPYVQRRAGSKDDRISPHKTYLARIHDRWFLGHFDEQWYGWNFDGWYGAGRQLDTIEDLYEIDLGVLP
jgi:hypothetical protein